MSSVESNLPNLRRLRLPAGGLCDPPSFGDDSTVTSLYLYEPSSTDLSSILISLGSHLKCLRLESSIKWEAVSTSALASLECLDLVGSCTQLKIKDFPPTLQKVTWEAMSRARVFEMLKLLSDPDYLPNLRSIPASFGARFGVNCEVEEQYSLSVYEKLRRQSFEVLYSRGLPHQALRPDRSDPESAHPVFERYVA